jgi:hypothetical protein
MGSYLTRPEGDERPEGETGIYLRSAHLCPCSTKGSGEGTSRTRLNLDFDHFKRAEGDIGKHLRRGRTSEPDKRLVLLAVLFAGKVHIGILEYLVKTVFEHSLQRVANKSGTKALPDTARALLGDEGLETGGEASVFCRVYLRSSVNSGKAK